MDHEQLEAQIKNLRLVEASEDVVDRISRKRMSEYLPLMKTATTASRRLKMVWGVDHMPKDNKEKPLGEDAHFICAKENAISVVDGVGSLAKQSVDAREHSSRLMINSAEAFRRMRSSSSFVDPKRVIREAFEEARELKGSLTACVIALNGCYLCAANVGDSGFMVFRDIQIMFRPSIQQHESNCPDQMGNDSKSDGPECAFEPIVPVRKRDIVVLGTNGMLDNLFIREIARIMMSTKEVNPERLAEKIAKMAYYESWNKD